MSTLRSLRGPVRSMFTRAWNDFQTEVAKMSDDTTELEVIFKRLTTHTEKLTVLDQQIEEELVAASASDQDLTTEYEGITDYKDKFTAAEIKYKKLVPEDCSESSSSKSRSAAIQAGSKYKLPKLEIKKFNGDPRDWLGFWNQFRSIHEDKVMQPEEKYQYLVQATVEKSPAREVVVSFPPSRENYTKAIDYLKSRFGDDELLVEIYVRDLLRHVLNNSSGKCQTSIIALYDKLETQLRALESLGVTRDKYAAMLYPLVESSLPDEIVRTWERVENQTRQDAAMKIDKLTRLMDFLRVEVSSEVRVKLAKEGFGKDHRKAKKDNLDIVDDTPTAIELYNGSQTRLCIFCGKGHSSQECNQARKLSHNERQRIVKDKRACFICLYVGHGAKKCRSRQRCLLCEGKHHAILCDSLKSSSKPGGGESEAPSDGNAGSGTQLSNYSCGNVFLQTLMVKIKGQNETREIRAIFDTGSQRSYVSEKAARVLDLKAKAEMKITHNLFGGSEIHQLDHKEYELEVTNIAETFSVKFSVLDQPKICSHITRVTEGPWLHELKSAGILINDVGEEVRDIHLLVGADIAGRLFTGRMYPTKAGPVGIETRLGWTLMGKCYSGKSSADSSLLVTTLNVSNVNIQDLWRLDLLGIKEPSETKTKEDLIQSASEHFLKTVNVNEEGRYEVSLPWIEGHPPVPINGEMAEKRLFSLTKKLEAANLFTAYDHIFKDWLTEGIIEEVKDCQIVCSYLPHRAVIKKESSTTPIRPVFDASAKPANSPSLNQCLETGPNLIEQIPSIITRFRLGLYGVVSDIRKAFLQISVKKEDRDFLQFLWWEHEQRKVKAFRHCRVVFGLTSSPFLLGATLHHHLEKYGKSYSETVELLRRSFYVDNSVVSMESEVAVSTFIHEASQIMVEGKFDLRGWTWNCPNGLHPDPITPVLGLIWNVNTDMFSLDLRKVIENSEGPVTKRKILSQAHMIFDPIGFSCPVTIMPKKLVQDIWKKKLGWDDLVPDEIAKNFLMWQSQLEELKSIQVERYLLQHDTKVTLHVFTDASAEMFAACVFVRCESSAGIKVQLGLARNRLATLKKITIPRLELLGCLIGARLCNEVKKDMAGDITQTYYWTDSANALYWIQKNDNWAEFVWNRVGEIRNLSEPSDWRHISGSNNPADLPSRGCLPRQLVSKKWWNGPEWMHLKEEEWPRSEVTYNYEEIQIEKKKTVVSSLVVEKREVWYRLLKGEHGELDYNRVMEVALVRVHREDTTTEESSTIEDICKAERYLIKIIQSEEFLETDKRLKQFHVKKDENGIWRVQTRIALREDSYDFRFPILLPSEHPLTRMFVEQEHKKMYHCGVGVLLITLRERFWILKARQLVRKVIHSCPQCRRFSAKKILPEEGPLPVHRVRDAVAFEVTGIDLGGPLVLREGRKSWFVVFTCAVYRAVHLELVTSLSTKALVGALERFMSRRVCPSVIYSDNGTNLVGVWEEFKAKGVSIDWRRNPPSGPWWGGWYERVVGMVKKLLLCILGTASVDYEEMITVLTDCERVINARPLTYMSEDPLDLNPLTPAMFLKEEKGDGIPVPAVWNAVQFGEEFKRRQALLTRFKKRFRDEYLSKLAHHGKRTNQQQLKVGDLVMIEVDNKKKILWPLARVLELFPGRDGIVRVVKLQTANGVCTRPVQRIYSLEVPAELVDRESKGSTVVEPTFTRSGREIRKPNRLQL